MKVQQNPTSNLKEMTLNTNSSMSSKKHAKQSFKGLESCLTTSMNFLQTSPAVGATIVDVTCMGAPRSAVDFTRGTDAGIETMRREFSSTGNDALLGFYGIGAATLLAHSLNSTYGVKAQGLFINDAATEIFANIRSKKATQEEFVQDAVSRLRGYNPSCETESAKAAHKEINSNIQKLVTQRMMNDLHSANPGDKLNPISREYMKTFITKSTGVEDRYKLEYGKIKTEASLEEMLNSIYKMASTLYTPKVSKEFKNCSALKDNAFIKGLKSLNKRTAIFGIGISVAIGLCVQPFNAYLTKKKTGKSGFVGGGGENKSGEFKLLKAEIGALGAIAALKTIGDGKFSNILKHIQFKSLIPTIDQFKFLYGATIVSRILSARNDNELRETTFKDSLAFVNWLILGGFVSKGVARFLEKHTPEKYIRYNEDVDGAGKFNWLTKSSIMTRKEVLIDAYKKIGLGLTKFDQKKQILRTKTISEMMKELKQYKVGDSAKILEATKAVKKIRCLGLIQFAGYIYSGVVLGVGLPKLNIAMTKAINKHHHKHDKLDAEKITK